MKPQYSLITNPPRRSYLRPFDKLLLVVAGVLLLAACGTPQFLVDPKASTNPENYFTDLNECQDLVDRRHSVGWEATKGGLIGVVTGGGLAYGASRLGHIPSGNNAYAVGAGALFGGLFGSIMSATVTTGNNQLFVKKCLEGRGHVILE